MSGHRRGGGTTNAGTDWAPVPSKPVSPTKSTILHDTDEPNKLFSDTLFPNDFDDSANIPRDSTTNNASVNGGDSASSTTHVPTCVNNGDGADHADSAASGPPTPTDADAETNTDPVRQRTPSDPTPAQRDSHACSGHA